MRKFAIATIVIALATVPAFAQQRTGPRTTRTDDQKRMDAEVDKEYQRTIRSTTDKSKPPPVTDPWGAVRSPSATPDKR